MTSIIIITIEEKTEAMSIATEFKGIVTTERERELSARYKRAINNVDKEMREELRIIDSFEKSKISNEDALKGNFPNDEAGSVAGTN